MIVCSCTGATAEQVRAGHRGAGTKCGTCLPMVEALLGGLQDCLLCPGKAYPQAGTLLGMPFCRRCHRRYLTSWMGLHIEAPPDVLAWAHLVYRLRLRHALEARPLRVATRAAHALLAGLEVELLDLQYVPRLEC